MKMRFSRSSAPSAALASCLALASAAGAAQPGSQEPFHAARSAPEKALDEIFHRSDNDDNLSEFVLKRPWYDAKKDKGYAPLFTQNLLTAWAGAEAQLVQHDCQGKYLDGEICGIDYSPITCGNATSDKGYVFRTKQADDRSASFSRDGRDQRRATRVCNTAWRKRPGAGGSTGSIAAMARSSISIDAVTRHS
jgi:hypothetical protein